MYRWIRPLLFAMPAEAAHALAFGSLRGFHRLPAAGALLRASFGVSEPELSVAALGLHFRSPVLLAAGFDKHALGYEALGDLGFGGVEVGTITAEAQPGNPRPRLFRLARDRALLNRMGFNNCGAAAAARHLVGPRRTVVGVNIGKTKRVPESEAIADYVKSAELLGPFADYLVVNVSSPNTPGLRDLQAVERLRPLLQAVQGALARVRPTAPPPLLVKIAPDLADTEILAITDLAIELGLQGIVATNTTISRSGLSTPGAEVEALGAGGISGAPLERRALQVLRLIRERAAGRLTLIAAGGISSIENAWERLRAGANLLQIYTAFVYEGPELPRRLAHGLLARARGEGFASVSAAIDHYRALSSASESAPQPARSALGVLDPRSAE
jgi:dihydroorotate dehydrogenase